MFGFASVVLFAFVVLRVCRVDAIRYSVFCTLTHSHTHSARHRGGAEREQMAGFAAENVQGNHRR